MNHASPLARVVVPFPLSHGLDVVSVVFFIMATIVLATIAYYRPAAALATFIVLEPFDVSRLIGATTITLPKVALVGIVLGLALRRTSLAPLRARVVRPLVCGLAAISVATAATIVPAPFYDPVVRETLKSLEYMLVACTALVGFAVDPDERFVWWGLGTAVAVTSILAIGQEFTTAPSGFFIGHTLGTQIVPRVAGPLDGPNQLAGWLGIAITLLATKALVERRSLGFAAIAVLGLVADALTFSRAGLVGLTLGAAFAARAWRSNEPRLRYVLPAAIALVLAVSVVPFALANIDRPGSTDVASILPRVLGNDEQSNENGLAPRTVLWRAALQMFARDPGLGIGAGNFEYSTPTVGLVGVRTHANSGYLQALAEGGVALFAATVWTLGATFWLLLRKPHSTLALAIVAAGCAYAGHQLFDTLDFYPKIGDLWYAFVGIGAARAIVPR